MELVSVFDLNIGIQIPIITWPLIHFAQFFLHQCHWVRQSGQKINHLTFIWIFVIFFPKCYLVLVVVQVRSHVSPNDYFLLQWLHPFLIILYFTYLIILIKTFAGIPPLLGSCKLSPASEPVNTAYVFSRKDLSR